MIIAPLAQVLPLDCGKQVHSSILVPAKTFPQFRPGVLYVPHRRNRVCKALLVTAKTVALLQPLAPVRRNRVCASLLVPAKTVALLRP